MRPILLAIMLVSTSLLMGCSGDDAVNPVIPDDAATYRVTFTAFWSAETHPEDFPSNPHFSPMVGGTHSDSVKFWDEGDLASAGIESMAERGITSVLTDEAEAAIADSTVEHVLLGGGIGPSPGEVSLEFTLSTEYPLVTLVSMLALSPDWFVGVAGLNLLQGDWVDSITVDLYLYDAGTDDGATYTAANAEADPHLPITMITGYPATVASEIPRIGTFTFVRQQ